MMSRRLLVLAGVVAAIAAPAPVQAQGTATLQGQPSGPRPATTFVCHGGPGLQVRIHADPSPSWRGPATYPTKPVQMALQFAGPGAFTDADKLPAGSCAWEDWKSGSGVPPREVYFDVNHPSGSTPTPASIRADLADAKRFYRFSFNYLIEGVPFVSGPRAWIPTASSQPAGPTTDPTAVAGTDPIIRQLMCRGGPSGLEFRVIADPSPAFPDPPKQVRVAMRYRVHLANDTAELALGSITPGSCGWDMQFGAPKPPGEVVIDLETDAQASNVSLGLPRDTSVRAGLSHPDTGTVRRYLSDSRHFWMFYHMDRGEPLAISHAAYEPDLTNLFVPVEKALTTASGTSTSTRGGVAGSVRNPGTSTVRSGATVRTPTTTTGSVGGAKVAGDTVSRAVATAARRISNVQTAPGPRGVRLTFKAEGVSWLKPSADVLVYISQARPTWDERRRRWVYPDGVWASVNLSCDPTGGCAAEPSSALEAGVRYYYLITLNTGEGSVAQRTGSFTAEVKSSLDNLFQPPLVHNHAR